MNKHLNDLTEVAASIINDAEYPGVDTGREVFQVPSDLLRRLQKLLEDTPIAEVQLEVFGKIAPALERKF